MHGSIRLGWVATTRAAAVLSWFLVLAIVRIDGLLSIPQIHRHHHKAFPRVTIPATTARSYPVPVASLHMSSASAISSNEELLPGIAAIDKANDELFAKLESLRENPYFRFYSVDILASCEYMPQELVECYTEACEIYPSDEDEV